MTTTQNARPAATLDAGHSATFRNVKALIGTYFGLSVATVIAVVLMRDDLSMVNSAVWTRTVIVLASSLITLSATIRAARGSYSSFRRLRIVTGVMTVAIIVIISLPGTFPTWLKIEQGICGLILLGVVALVNGKALRSAFAAK
ncbi:MAG TPA: hypothetical protein VHZ97_22505 [Pseudonocardiaceae bacterium]|jgi:hypothetical protein|nr:hypothetical protein [Pseudonocardiaceae bacterium]